MTSHLSILDASIEEIQRALSKNQITSVDLVFRFLLRVAVYDANGDKLSAIPILNPKVFEEAAASDAQRYTGNGPRSILEGIPFLVKDNFMVKGMTAASGSPAFESLVASNDSEAVKTLRRAGAVLIGRTNMPPMAYGGMQRGLYGRAENPYNLDYLAAGYASGSSNGSAVALASSMCVFSLGSETVSSGRSPASNNAVVAYTPSRGVLPMNGVWPLYPTCDVIVPHTRSVEDLVAVTDVLLQGKTALGDFWRAQPFLSLPTLPDGLGLKANLSPDALRGKRLGVPRMYIGAVADGLNPPLQASSQVFTRQSVIKRWERTKLVLEACGAEVVELDSFPLITEYEKGQAAGVLVTVDGLPNGWMSIERSDLVAHAWDDFLAANAQVGLDTLGVVDPDLIFPLAPGSLAGFTESANKLRWADMVEYAKSSEKPGCIYEIEGMGTALKALEEARRETLEKWMDANRLDAVIFPANGDVGPANADIDLYSSELAWRNGVKYSNGNRPIRHLGIPTVSVTMGLMDDIHVPVSLTFAGRGYDDANLVKYAYAYEAASRFHEHPPCTPALASDIIPLTDSCGATAPALAITTSSKTQNKDTGAVTVTIKGTIEPVSPVEVYINGIKAPVSANGTSWTAQMSYDSSQREKKWQKWSSPLLNSTMVIIKATSGGRTSANLSIL